MSFQKAVIGAAPLEPRIRHQKQNESDKLTWEQDVQEDPAPLATGKSSLVLSIIAVLCMLGFVAATVGFFLKLTPQPTSLAVASNPKMELGVAEEKPVNKPKELEVAQEIERNPKEVLAEFEPLVRQFLNAKTVDEILPLVRHAQRVEAKIRHLYPAGEIKPLGFLGFSASIPLQQSGRYSSVMLQTADENLVPMVCVETPEGMKVDWESWVGWSELPWQEFINAKPITGHVFRVKVSPTNYYNYQFNDPQKWQSYQISDPTKQNIIYGYVERGTILEQLMKSDVNRLSTLMMLTLKYPKNAQQENQVIIEDSMGQGWVNKQEKP